MLTEVFEYNGCPASRETNKENRLYNHYRKFQMAKIGAEITFDYVAPRLMRNAGPDGWWLLTVQNIVTRSFVSDR